MADEQQDSSATLRADDVDAAGSSPAAPIAGIKLLYESRDGRFCLFEDAEGHLAAVDASRLV